jgi:hypothetical protein
MIGGDDAGSGAQKQSWARHFGAKAKWDTKMTKVSV